MLPLRIRERWFLEKLPPPFSILSLVLGEFWFGGQTATSAEVGHWFPVLFPGPLPRDIHTQVRGEYHRRVLRLEDGWETGRSPHF